MARETERADDVDTGRIRMLLDVEAMQPVLAQLPALRSRPVAVPELEALWVKPGRYFNVQYRLRLEDSPGEQDALVSAFIVSEERGARELARASSRGCDGECGDLSCIRCVTRLADSDLFIQGFPFDYRLPTLPRCLDRRSASKAMGKDRRVKKAVTVAYRPGMRCQIRYALQDGNTLYGKVAVEKRGPGYSFGVQRRLSEAIAARTSSIHIPSPDEYVDRLKLTLVSEIHGTNLVDIMRGQDDCRDALRRVGAAISELHGLDAAIGERTHRVDNECELIATWVNLVSEIFPDLGVELTASLEKLLAERPTQTPPNAIVHRDFYDKQIVLGEGPTTLLDMDTASRGDAELDIGNFVAHLFLRGVQKGESERCKGWSRQFLESYPAAFDSSRARWYERSALLRLACYYAIRPHWKHIAAALTAASCEDER